MSNPLRDVRSETLSLDMTFRVLSLSCGHCLIRQPAQKIPQRARCRDCCPICGKATCKGHPPGDGDPRDGSGRAEAGDRHG